MILLCDDELMETENTKMNNKIMLYDDAYFSPHLDRQKMAK